MSAKSQSETAAPADLSLHLHDLGINTWILCEIKLTVVRGHWFSNLHLFSRRVHTEPQPLNLKPRTLNPNTLTRTLET